ncbi:MAG TPA: DUF3800 domain-containing protein [Candidatus Limnocylindrales bacterium]|nr:DUF3800 domain-containing protein [Candidatus Limnocylindrales bacterium]
MFVDEAGETTGPYFVVGMFATGSPLAWRRRLDAVLTDYPYSLHFHKLARKPDGRYRATHAVLDLLERTTDWYGHYLRIDRRLVTPAYFGNQDQIEFNKWVGMLIQKRTEKPHVCYEVIIADRQRNHADGYLTSRLQVQLDRRRRSDGSHVVVGADLARHDRLLQLADLLGSAVRQSSVPSSNPCKLAIAERVSGLIRPMTGHAARHQRLYGWEWRPSVRAA